MCELNPQNFTALLNLVRQHVKTIDGDSVSDFLDEDISASSMFAIVVDQKWDCDDIDMERVVSVDYYTPYLAVRDLLIDKILYELKLFCGQRTSF